jgi:4-carboxymuconolactone decarboxylase
MQTLRLARVAFFAMQGKWTRLRAALQEAAAASTSRAVEECLLQLILFAGFPTGIEAFRVWTRVRRGAATTRESGGDRASWVRSGHLLCKKVYGGKFEPLRRVLRHSSPELDSLMLEWGYGRVLSRPGLSAARREALTFAALLGVDRPRQLRAHMDGCLNLGVEAGELKAILADLGPHAGARRARAAQTLLDLTLAERKG